MRNGKRVLLLFRGKKQRFQIHYEYDPEFYRAIVEAENS